MTTIEASLKAEEALRDDLANYAGQWIALKDLEVIASAPTLGELLAAIEESEIDEIFEVSDGEIAVGFFFRA